MGILLGSLTFLEFLGELLGVVSCIGNSEGSELSVIWFY